MPDSDPLTTIVHELNRQSANAADRGDEEASPARTETPRLAVILKSAIAANASDVLLANGAAVTLRVNGALRSAGGDVLAEADIRAMVLPLLNSREQKQLRECKSVDFAFASAAGRRFRVNLHYQRRTLAAAIRVLPKDVPRLASLDLPASLAQLATLRRGLIVVAGPTGSGKSTTLAALIDEINRARQCHIVTIEDPIEFVHPNRMALVEQIEVGIDTPNANESLRSVLRQSPDVILVGEMRDAETIALALTAAETGHLVLSTLHTNDSAQAISRMVDCAPADSQPQVRQQLSLSIAAIVTQQLVPAAKFDGRVVACEVLLGTDAVRNLIRQKHDHQLKTQMTLSRAADMITMDQSLAQLVHAGKITADVALSHSVNRDEMKRLLPPNRA